MKTNEIRAELVKRGIKVVDIAQRCKVKHPNVSAVIAGRRPTAHIRKAIAKAINKDVSEIWPETAGEKRA